MGLFKDMPATDKMKLKTTLPWVEIKNRLNGKSEKELLFHSDKKDMMKIDYVYSKIGMVPIYARKKR